ncbi:MAG: hypothetical protein AAF607_03740 [Pseudomonadota bacterium]
MRFIQLPLWLSLAMGLAVYFGSIDKDLATGLIFASVFGFIYGGVMSTLKPPSQLGQNSSRDHQGGFGRKPYMRRKPALRRKKFGRQRSFRQAAR